jgi:hypothetical protein
MILPSPNISFGGVCGASIWSRCFGTSFAYAKPNFLYIYEN